MKTIFLLFAAFTFFAVSAYSLVIEIECGDSHTVILGSDFFGGIDSYNCDGDEIEAYGPETFFAFTIEDYTNVTASITEITEIPGAVSEARMFVHVFIFNEYPSGSDPIACGDGNDPAIIDCLPAGEYYIVVDFSSNNYPGNYKLEIECSECDPVNINKEIIDINNIKAYPNPVSSILNVQFPENSLSGTYNIFDSKGRLVREGEINSVYMQIDISDMNSGGYFIRTSIDNEDYFSRFNIIIH